MPRTKPTETRLRSARRLRELSQKEAATRADVSQQFWSDVERGSSLPTIDLAHRMAAALGFAAHELWPPQTEGRRA